MNQNGPAILIPSKRYDVWSRLYSRYKLEPFPSEGGSAASVAAIVQPVTQADELLKARQIAVETISVTGTGIVTAHTVPKGERWTLRALRVAVSSGTWTFNALGLADPAANSFFTEVFTTTTGRNTYFEGQTMVVDEGWLIQFNVDVHSVTGNVLSSLFYESEDAF